MNAQDRVIVALDMPSLDLAAKLLKDLAGTVTYYKIGFELFTAAGWKAVELVRQAGGRVFLDLKLHDIPHTVSKTAAVLSERQVEIFNVHTLGGLEMMKAARQAVDQNARAGRPKPLVLGVTILTSHTQETLSKEIRIEKDLQDQVLHLARLAKEAGLDGVVSSPQEIALIRKKFPKDFLIVTPGIRPSGSAKGDQKRTLEPREALREGADYIVVGRPITEAPEPKKAALSLIESLR